MEEIGLFTTNERLAVTSWDAWMARATGTAAARAQGRSIADLFPEAAARGLLKRFENVLANGVVEVLAPAFHGYFFPCNPSSPSSNFSRMQQYVTIAPLREKEKVVGALVTVEDVTARLDRERSLAAKLKSGEETVRLTAAQNLSAEAAPQSSLLLTDVMGDESWRVRKAAVEGLAKRGGKDAVETLLRSLRDEHADPGVLNSALQVLAMLDIDVVTPLADFLKSPDADLRIYAALALGEQNHAQAAPALLAALEDSQANVRYQAIESLGKLRAPEAVEPLLKRAAGGDAFEAFAAVEALTRIGDARGAASLLPLLSDAFLREPVIRCLGALGGSEAVGPLTALLKSPSSGGASPAEVCQALAALHRRFSTLYGEGAHIADGVRRAMPAEGVDRLLAALETARTEELAPLALVLGWLEGPAVEMALIRLLGQRLVRQEVLEALVRHGERVTELLVQQLAASDMELRRAAVLALGRIGDRRAVPGLVKILQNNDELSVFAAGALAKIGDPRAFDPLVALLGHADAAVRQSAIAALNSLGHADMPRRAAALLAEADPLLRESGVKIAGYFGYPECLEKVLALCRDGDERVRRAALEHLPYFDDARALDVLKGAFADPSSGVRASAARALAHLEEGAVPVLVGALRDADPWVRYYAARSLGRLNAAAAVDALAAAAQMDAAAQVRAAALESLGRVGGARAVDILAPFARAEEPDLARAAVNALGRINDPAALRPILEVLQSADAAKRAGAVQALVGRQEPEALAALVRAAKGDPDMALRKTAVDGLAESGDPTAVHLLVELAAQSGLRQSCVAALSRAEGKTLPVLLQKMTDRRPEVRRAVVDILSRVRRPAATESLVAALGDPDAGVRGEAQRVLNDLGRADLIGAAAPGVRAQTAS